MKLRSAPGTILLPLVLSHWLFPPSACAAGAAPLPRYDFRGHCRTQANYSFAATLGESNVERVFADCEAREANAKAVVATLWPLAAPNGASRCLDLADGKYTWLAQCLDDRRRMRTAR